MHDHVMVLAITWTNERLSRSLNVARLDSPTESESNCAVDLGRPGAAEVSGALYKEILRQEFSEWIKGPLPPMPDRASMDDVLYAGMAMNMQTDEYKILVMGSYSTFTTEPNLAVESYDSRSDSWEVEWMRPRGESVQAENIAGSQYFEPCAPSRELLLLDRRRRLH